MLNTACFGFAHLQVGFFEVVALPLFRCMATVVPGARSMLDGSIKNYMMWRLDSEQD